MTPRMQAIITARNDSGPGFQQVVKDAETAANSVVASGTRASRAAQGHGNALTTLAKSSANAANQQRNLVFQLNDTAVSLAGGANPLMVFAQQGSQIATIYSAQEGGLGRAFKETGNLAVGMITKFWPISAAVAAGTVAIAGMTAEINKSSKEQVSFGDVAMATWQVFADGVYNLVQPAIGAVVGWLGSIWDTVRPSLVSLGNGLVGIFVGAFDATKAVWGRLPAVMGDIAISTANSVIDGIEGMINGAIGLLNDFTGSLKGFGIDLGVVGNVDFGGLSNSFAGAAGDAGSSIGSAFGDAMGVDYLGGAFDAITTKAVALAAAARLAAEAAKGTSKEVGPLSLGLKAANDNAETLGETLAGQLTSGVMSIWQAFRSGGNVLEAISNQLQNFADQLLSQAVSGFFSNLFGSALGGSLLGPTGSALGGFGSYGKFANGGDFTVGGSGGTDSQMVNFMATPGESVSIRTPGQNGGGGSVINNTWHIDARGAEIGVEQKIMQAIKAVVPEMIRSQAPVAVANAQRGRLAS